MGKQNKISKSVLSVLLVAVLLFPASLLAARKHGDVDKIGNRNVAGKVGGIVPIMVSLNSEMQLGAQAAAQVEQTVRLFEDPVVTEYINRIGQNLVKHSDAKVPFHIKVVDSDEINAFALPGGYFYVNKGLITTAENEAELAGVMAHEISHVAARHTARMLTKMQLTQIGLMATMIFAPPVSYGTATAIQNALGLGLNLTFLGITRESEKEADQLGIQYLWNTGYDPQAFISFFEKLKAQEKNPSSRLAGWFRTHPSVPDRMTRASEELKFLPAKEEYVVNTSEFDKVKSRILAIDNPVKLANGGSTNPGDRKRPTLKRRTGGEGDSDPGEERPTLKKKDTKEAPTLKRPGEEKDTNDGPTLKRPGDQKDKNP